VVEELPSLAAYVACGESRPAFRRAFAAQAAVFRERCPVTARGGVVTASIQ